MKTNMTMLELVQEAKTARGWTREDVAEALGVSRYTLRSWLKPEAASGREAPSWALCGLRALITEQVVYEQRGWVRVAYEPATARYA